MKVSATLFDPATDARLTVEDDYATWKNDAEGLGAVDYLWTDGNYACDCNKRLFLARAGAPGYSADVGQETPCGDTIKLERLVLDTGEIVVGEGKGEVCMWCELWIQPAGEHHCPKLHEASAVPAAAPQGKVRP